MNFVPDDESTFDPGDVDTELGAEADGEDYEQEVDDMLEGLMESEDVDLAERRRRRRARRVRQARRGVPTAGGRSAYRAPTPSGPVTQRQLHDALARVGTDVRRNAAGIKTINTQVANLNTRVDGIVSVNTLQSRSIARLNKQMQLDGALSFAQALQVSSDDTGLVLTPNLGQLLQGAVKTGVLGGTTGAFSNPAVVGGLGFLLNNPAILGNVLAPRTP